MHLEYKPDLDDALRRWDAFWQGEVLGRPCLNIVAPREGVEPAPAPRQLAGLHMSYRQVAEAFDAHAASHAWMAEAIPFYRPGWGPDQFAAFLGAELRISADSGDTNWAVPFVDDWDAAAPLAIDENRPAWRNLIESFRTAAEVGEGKFILSQLDIHSNMDALLALRGSERLCMDLVECPEKIERAMTQVRP